MLWSSLTSEIYTKGVTLPSFSCLCESEQSASFPAKSKTTFIWTPASCFPLTTLLPGSPHLGSCPLPYSSCCELQFHCPLLVSKHLCKINYSSNSSFLHLHPLLLPDFSCDSHLTWFICTVNPLTLNSLRQGMSFTNNQATRALESHPGKLILKWELISLPSCCQTSQLPCKTHGTPSCFHVWL